MVLFPVLLFLNSCLKRLESHREHWPFELHKSFACSADFEVDHVSDLYFPQESIVLLCLLLFSVDSPLEVTTSGEHSQFFESNTSKSGTVRPNIESVGRLQFVHTPDGIDFIDAHQGFSWKTGAGANSTLEVHLPNNE